MNTPSRAAIALLLASLVATTACGGAEPDAESSDDSNLTGDDEVSSWVRESAVALKSVNPGPDDSDLAALDGLVRSASLVGFGEANHNIHDHPQLRNRLFQYLVKKHGVRVLVLESGVIEGRLVERYVQGDESVSLQQALFEGITHEMGKWEEMKTLIEWMHAYNQGQKSPATKIHFAGPDLPVVGDAPDVPLAELDAYLTKVDPAYRSGPFQETFALAKKTSAVTTKVAAILRQMFEAGKIGSPNIDPDLLDGFGTISYDQLSADEQRQLDDKLDALAKHVKENKASYVAASSADEYAWGSHMTAVALQMVRDLKSRKANPKILFIEKCHAHLKTAGLFDSLVIHHYEADPNSVDDYRTYFKGRTAREQALAENVIWAQERYGKAFAFAHNGHLIKATTDVSIGSLHIGATGQTTEGQWLAKHYKGDYVMLNGSFDRYVSEAGEELTTWLGAPVKPTSACTDCFEKPLAAVAAERKAPAPLLLDLATARGSVRKRLEKPRQHRDQRTFQTFSPLEAYDAMLFVKDMRPAKSLDTK